MEKTAANDGGVQGDATTRPADGGGDIGAPDVGARTDQSVADLPASVVEFAELTAGVAMNASDATTEAVDSADPVFLWVVTFSASRPNPPSVDGFDVVDVQIAGNRRQLALLRADAASGPLAISFAGQPQDAILWVAVSSTHGVVGLPSSFQSQGVAASVPIIGADSASTGALGGFIVGGMVTATADPGFALTGSACGGGACLLTVAGPGPANGVGLSWSGESPWIGTGVAVTR